LLYADDDEQAKYHAPDAVFGRFFYYEEPPTDVLEKSFQCRLILFEDLDKDQVEDLLGEIFFRLGLDESASGTDIFFATRERSFSLFREVGDDLEDEDEEESEGLFSGEHKELDAERLRLPNDEEEDTKSSESKSKK